MKKPKIQVKLPLKTENEKLSNLAYSFEYLTTNKKFNFDYFKSDIRGKVNAYDEFFKFLRDISKETRLSVSNRRKEDYLGYEELSYGSLNFIAKADILSKGDNVFVFRFCKSNYRVIGFFKNKVPIFYIIGFDFSYSAYNH